MAGDKDVLAAFQLITNDDVTRKAQDVTTELVEQLKKAGKNPKWYVSEVWLESTYGRKGEPKPGQAEGAGTRDRKEPTRTKPRKGEANASRDRKPGSESEHGESDSVYLPDDIEFLKERIRILEREKQEEAERNEKREAKLFEQLAVKDRQISAWDEVTQGITKGLATGAIQPKLSSGMAPVDEREQKPESSSASKGGQVAEVVDATPAAPKKTAAKKRNTRKPPRKKAAKKRLPKWYEMPTLKKVLSRREL